MALFDDAVGEIVGALKETGQLRDTLLVYTTDHGWTDKGFAYEGSSHVPLLLQWPRLFGAAARAAVPGGGVRGGGLVVPQLVSTIDVAATALEAASRGTRAPPASMDGLSVLHLLAPDPVAAAAGTDVDGAPGPATIHREVGARPSPPPPLQDQQQQQEQEQEQQEQEQRHQAPPLPRLTPCLKSGAHAG